MSVDPCLIVLASGQSRRFGDGSKLLAQIDGGVVADRSALFWAGEKRNRKIAVIPSGFDELGDLYRKHGWSIVQNDHPENGQSVSLRLGVERAINLSCDGIIVALADMPFVTTDHLHKVKESLRTHKAVMSRSGPTLLPPAGFDSVHFPQILALSGDRGAGSVFRNAADGIEIAMPEYEAMDIDTRQDLLDAKERSAANV